MSKRKRHIIGRVYLTNDSLLSRDGYSKSNRRIVSMNNDKNKMHVVKIMSLYDKNGQMKKNLVPIEKYNFLSKPSGVHPFVFNKTGRGHSINENMLRKTNGRLNKWDMNKIQKKVKK